MTRRASRVEGACRAIANRSRDHHVSHQQADLRALPARSCDSVTY